MGLWLLKVVGVVFLGVMVDILYPSGATNKFCKGIFSLITLFVIISPIFNHDITSYSSTDSTFVVSSDYKNINDSLIKSQVDSLLEDAHISDAIVEINSNVTNGEYNVTNICVDMSNVVLLDTDENINIYEDIAEKISNLIGAEKDQVIVYG